MPRFPIGIIILIVASILIYFGLAHRILDRLRISDKTALAVIGAMILGSFIDIPIPGRVDTAINVGGGLIPIGLAVYLLIKAGTTKEWVRALVAAAITGGVVYFVSSVLLTGHGTRGFLEYLDSVYVYPIIGGLVAYIAGRSRRAAFVAATLGVLFLDVANYVFLSRTRIPGEVFIGGGGAFDSIVIAGIIAVLLAEIVGETRERLQGGPATEGRPEELLKALENAEYANSMGTGTEDEALAEKDNRGKEDK